MLIAEHYGLLLDFKALGKLLGYEPEVIANKHYAGELGIPMEKINGKGRFVAHYEDVADYIDGYRAGKINVPSSQSRMA